MLRRAGRFPAIRPEKPAVPRSPSLLPLLAAALASAGVCWAQPGARGKPRPANPAEVKRLDAKLKEVSDAFLRDTSTLIASYESVGQFERARVLLEALQKLDPDNETIQKKVGELTEKILDANRFEVELEPGEGWKPVGTVTKGRPLRIAVTGDYKLSASLELGPDGVPADDPGTGLVVGIPLGAVMAVIAPPDAAATGKKNDRPPKPFLVGSSLDKSADADGVLYLRVNTPPGAKCTGSLAVELAGPEPQ